MNRKIISTLGLVGLLVIILLLGGLYIFLFQRGDLEAKREKLKELKAYDYDTDQLLNQLETLELRAAVLDSILAARKFNIPYDISSIKFYDFLNNIGRSFSSGTQMDIEYMEQKADKDFQFYEYKIGGTGPFSDLYKLLVAIENSKELKKINSAMMNNYVGTDEDGYPQFMVSYVLNVKTYFADNNRFTTADFVENDLSAKPVYDAFFPLIRNEIPPNIDMLLDVQGARLLALIPEGAFLADSRGNTYLIWEGDPVYLGYLTKIDYDHNMVSFILNKGGIIEKVDIELAQEDKTKKK